MKSDRQKELNMYAITMDLCIQRRPDLTDR